eukprot:12666842-Heterocapsa_arctica.AAC.1
MPCPQPSVVQGMPGLGCSRHMGHCPTSSGCTSVSAAKGSASGAVSALESALLRASSESELSSALSGCHTRLIWLEMSAMLP